MMYLILRETKYSHTTNAYDVVDCTEDHTKAVEKLQGYILINDRKLDSAIDTAYVINLDRNEGLREVKI